MKYITRDDDISVYPFTGRLMNCLRRAGIHTVGALLDYPQTEILKISNMGKKGIQDIETFIEDITVKKTEYELLVDSDAIVQKEADEKKERTIEELSFSQKAKNCLGKMNIVFVSDLFGISKDDLLEAPGIGQKTAEEILAMIAKLEVEYSMALGQSVPYEFQVAKEMSEYWGQSEAIWLREIMNTSRDDYTANEEEIVSTIYSTPFVVENVKKKLVSEVGKFEYGIEVQKLTEYSPEHLKTTEILQNFLHELKCEGIVRIEDEIVSKAYPTLTDYISRITSERNRELFVCRLENKTLEEIGEQFNLTRERVRQIIKSVIEKKPRLDEDQYKYIYEHYNFSCKEFQEAFGESALVYNYLELVYSNNEEIKKPIEELMRDDLVPLKLKKKFENATYSSFVLVDGKRLKKNKSVLTAYVVKQKCLDLTSMEQYLAYYYAFLEELGIKDDPNLVIDERSYANKLNTSKYTLWNQWRSFRYYNIASRDYEELLETIDLESYENIELSSMKFYRDYPELMKEYDIRDEYELHNLLKKIYPDDGKVTFKRMPTIEIGTADRNKQIMDLLAESWPISAEEFGQLYEERYGVKASTILGVMKEFNQYYYNGVYYLQSEELAEDISSKLKELLVDDFYSIKEIQKIFKREFPKESVLRINQYTLKKLGFHIYSGYVIKNTFSNAVEYFNWCLTKDDFVNTLMFKKEMTTLVTYMSELYRLRREWEIIEYKPSQYISKRKLSQMGITMEDIEDFCESVMNYVPNNQYFTFYSLKKVGFSHYLQDKGFEDWFYGSILAEDKKRFSYRKTGKNKILLVGEGDVQIETLLESIVEKHDRILLEDLDMILREDYDLTYPLDKIIELTKGSSLYYNAITGYVYFGFDGFTLE